MFERMSERARRVLFFARYEASQLGSLSIETEHLLLGLIREGKGLTSRIFTRHHVSLDTVRRDIEGRTVYREKVTTSVEIPFSIETKRVLMFAADEADRLQNPHIGTEHFLLGLLREERSVAAMMLMRYGMPLDAVRADVVGLAQEADIDPSRDRRPYAIKRTQRNAKVGSSTVATVAGKHAAFRSVCEFDDRLSESERRAGWEHYFEPVSEADAQAGTPSE